MSLSREPTRRDRAWQPSVSHSMVSGQITKVGSMSECDTGLSFPVNLPCVSYGCKSRILAKPSNLEEIVLVMMSEDVWVVISDGRSNVSLSSPSFSSTALAKALIHPLKE